MENVVLVILLVIALFLIAVVLLQRSEGGALGIGGGGGGGGGLMTGRSAATALTKLTWGLGAAFVGASLLLTILASRDARDESVVRGVEPESGEFELLIPDLGDPLAPPAPETSEDTPFEIQLEPAAPASGEQGESSESPQTEAPADAPSEAPAEGDSPAVPPSQ